VSTIQSRSEAQLTGRERRRLRLARENAYLPATCPDNRRIAKLHGLWCWKLKIPIVWFERLTPRSKFGRVHLDMMTTPNALTPAGQTAMRALGARFQATGAIQVSPNDGHWDHVPLANLEPLCGAVLKAAVTVDHYRLNRTKPGRAETPSRKVLKFVPKESATA
jgi:hypothetical protein